MVNHNEKPDKGAKRFPEKHCADCCCLTETVGLARYCEYRDIKVDPNDSICEAYDQLNNLFDEKYFRR